jgi:hypothetical protein
MRAGGIFVSAQQSVIHGGRWNSLLDLTLLGASGRFSRAHAFIVQGLWLLLFSASVGAATFRVTNTLGSGPGSFQQALLDASSNQDMDTILLTDVSGQITLSSFPSVGNVVIAGPGARHLTIVTPRIAIDGAATTTISRIRLLPAQPLFLGTQGGIIYNAGTLFLQDCEFTSAQMYIVFGAGIYNAGNLTISGCTIANNSTFASGNAYPPSCGAGKAGGLYVGSGNVWITNSTFSGNSASSYYVCNGVGGAVYVQSGNVSFVNCTLTGNFASQGGAIYNAGGSVWLENTIVTDSVVGVSVASGNNLFTNASAAGLGPLMDNGGPTMTHALSANSPAINKGTSNGAPPTDQRGVARPQGSGWDVGAYEFERPFNHFELDLAVHGPGRISSDPERIFYPSNEVVVLTAIPDEDYELAGWSGDAMGLENPLPIRMDRDQSILADFQYAPATVTNLPGTANYVINTNSWGLGSLRQAIRDINASGGGTIRFSNVIGIISLTMGLPSLGVDVRIEGPGPSNLLVQVPAGADGFRLDTGVTGIISGITIQSSQSTSRWGGAISNSGTLSLRRVHFVNSSSGRGGALFNDGHLLASDCVFSNNAATAGGAIYNRGSLQVSSSIFETNRSTARAIRYVNDQNDGGGGAFYNESGQASYTSCGFVRNTALGLPGGGTSVEDLATASGLGGAVYVAGGQVGFFETSISGNSARGQSGLSYEVGHFSGNGGSAMGSGIYVGDGTLTLTNCALVNNLGVAGDSPGASRYPGGGGVASGGAIYMNSGNLFAVNCTLSGNEVRSGNTGGGGYLHLSGGGRTGSGGALSVYQGTGTLANCTITANRALGGDSKGIYGTNYGRGIGGGISSTPFGDNSSYWSTGSVLLVNTIVAENQGSTNGMVAIVDDDLNGPGFSLGHNLIGTVGAFTNLLSSDLVGVNPRLGPLQDNGGPTLSHALLANSPAIDAGTSGLLAVDQRGQPRSIDHPATSNGTGSDGTDIGATEVDPTLRLTRVSKSGDDVHVRFTTVSDKTYRLQYRSEVAEAPWLTLPFTVAGSGGIVTVTNMEVGSLRGRFYRAVEQ